MQRYIGTKIVEAQSIDLGSPSAYLGWSVPADGEDPECMGYLVKYPSGYESWSPAEVFNTAYSPIADDNKVQEATLIRMLKLADKQEHIFWGKELVISYKLKSGFTVSGRAACVDPDNFDMEVGRSIAFRNALDQLWPLEGYVLQKGLASS